MDILRCMDIFLIANIPMEERHREIERDIERQRERET